MARKVCRGPSNSLLMHRAKNLSGPFFQNTGPMCVKSVGNAWAPGGPLSSVRPIAAVIIDANTIQVTFSACVDVVAGPGTYYTINNGVPIELALPVNVNGDGKTWSWTLTTPVSSGDVVLWNYVGDSYIVDCAEGEDIGEYLNVPVFNPSAPWSPADLFFSGEEGAWYDPSDFSTLFQDDAGTTPVTAVGQTVGRINDKSGNGLDMVQATLAARPVLRQDANSNYYLELDGVDDILESAWTLTMTPPWTFTFAMEYGGGSESAVYVDCFGIIRYLVTNYMMFRRRPSQQRGRLMIRGDNTEPTSQPATSHYFLVGSLMPGQPYLHTMGVIDNLLWGEIDGGNYGEVESTWTSADVYPLDVGIISGSANFGEVRHMYDAVAINRALTTQEQDQLDAYIAAKSGVTLP